MLGPHAPSRGCYLRASGAGAVAEVGCSVSSATLQRSPPGLDPAGWVFLLGVPQPWKLGFSLPLCGGEASLVSTVRDDGPRNS